MAPIESAKEAENLVVQKFPERILHLNELLSMPVFQKAANDVKCKLEIPIIPKSEENVDNCEGKTPGKRARLDSNSYDTSQQPFIPCNKNVTEIINIFKPNIVQLAKDTKALKMWVSLLIPKIEDGNNFGVSIQAETLTEIQQTETQSLVYLAQVSRYYSIRGNMVSKAVKYPYIEDYQRAIEEFDERQFLTMTFVIQEIRNRYSSLHDIIIKNLDKIKKPRSSNTDSFY